MHLPYYHNMATVTPHDIKVESGQQNGGGKNIFLMMVLSFSQGRKKFYLKFLRRLHVRLVVMVSNVPGFIWQEWTGFSVCHVVLILIQNQLLEMFLRWVSRFLNTESSIASNAHVLRSRGQIMSNALGLVSFQSLCSTCQRLLYLSQPSELSRGLSHLAKPVGQDPVGVNFNITPNINRIVLYVGTCTYKLVSAHPGGKLRSCLKRPQGDSFLRHFGCRCYHG